MKTNYILIDFENVQPKNLEVLKDQDFKVIVFVGANQTKIPFELASAMQSLESNAEYVKIEGNGPNALDFHIAFYIGKLASEDKDAFFHIISKDKGFEPLIKHLKTQKILAMRENDISEIPILKISTATSKNEKIDTIVTFLKSRGSGKPRKVKTLSNAINCSLFARTLNEQELDDIVQELVNRKIVVKNGVNVSYKLTVK